MKRTMVRYECKPEAVAENEELIRGVFAELAAERPAGLRYACFLLEDGVTFVHIATQSGELGPTDFPAFKAFQAQHASRVVARPVVSQLREIGGYG
jgi:hypothetical protein